MRAVDAVARSLAAIDDDGRHGIWIARIPAADALAAAADVDRRVDAGDELPLAGLTLAVKGNIDVAGLATTAGCPAFAYEPAVDAPVVAALRAAGAVVMGSTNLDQFATGLVGVRSPYGVTPNAHWDGLIAGGSSSGSAVAVAAGLVDIALGTDTAGSGRVPAACNGIVGLKPTRGRLSARGVVPACRSLDCVSVLARDVATAALVTAIAAGPDAADPWSRPVPMTSGPGRCSLRLGIPGELEGWSAPACEEVAVDLGPFVETGALLYGGAFVAERYEAVGAFVDAHPDDVHPVVGGIISAGGRLPAWQVFRDRTELQRLAARTRPVWDAIDVLAVPSVPRVPTVAEVLAEPIAVNTMLGTYTNFVNLLDLCALTIPVGPALPTAPPPSVTLIAPAGGEDVLVSLAASLPGTPASPRTP